MTTITNAWYLLPFAVRDILVRAFKTGIAAALPSITLFGATDYKTVAIVFGATAGTVVLNAILAWAKA